ncbi:MAG: hypothetical protein MK193_09345 [Lentisphaeria bacterium]|nr:hypothetical protein [Lentisphaeria bacterium]
MKITTLVLILSTILPQIISAQEISSKSIQLFKTDSLQAPQSDCDYFPFLQMDLSNSSKTFLLAFCEYEITWADQQNDSEQIEYSFLDLSLSSGNNQTFKPIGQFTADQRLSFIRKPKYASVDAKENWGAKTLRFGALFVVDKSINEFTISFAGEKTKTKASEEKLSDPSEFAKIEILECKLIDSTTIKNSRLKRNIPELEVSLSNPFGKLLKVKTTIFPLAPNVIGGEYRYIFRPSDFLLLSEKQVLKPLGFLSNDNFGKSTIYNLSRASNDELKKTNQEITLIFAVKPNFKSGELIFLNKVAGQVSTK